MKKTVGRLSCALAVIILVGCHKSDFVYYAAKPVEARAYNFQHRVKDIQGESAVDIVWVIDNSGSMQPYQAELSRNASSFMSQFMTNGLDWKIGIISTDISNRPYLGFDVGNEFNFKSPNPVQTFQTNVMRLGTMGDGIERAFAPIRDKVKEYPHFFRRNAMLAVIFLTDAPEQSERSFPGSSSSAIDAPELHNILKTLKGGLNRVISYGVFGAEDLGCEPTDDPWNYAGSRYEDFIKPLKGKVYPLCDKNFGANLASMGKDLLTRVRSPKIVLKTRPKLASLQVVYAGKILPGGAREAGGYWFYDFDLNAIVFHDLDFAEGDTEQVRVIYDEDV